MSWYVKHRPDNVDDIEGNEAIKVKVQGYIDDPSTLPNTLMFSGEPGTGKTTFGRIISKGIDAELLEVDCANNRTLPEFRAILEQLPVVPITGKRRIVLLDEIHRLPTATQAILLKSLEDGWSHTTLIMCSSNPGELLSALRNRPITYHCSPLEDDDMRQVIRRVARAEGIRLKVSVMQAILDASDGSSRQALTLLESIAGLDYALMLKTIRTFAGETPEEVITLCRAIMRANVKYSVHIAPIIKTLEGEPEVVRRQVLGYAVSCLGKSPRAYNIVNAFRDNFYDTGKAGIAIACYEACMKE